MRPKYIVLAIILAALVIIDMTACSKPEPVTVGFVAALSGKASEIGVGARNALRLRTEEINKTGGINGRQVKLVISDNEGNPKKTRKILDNYIASGIKFIVGPLYSQMAEATLEAIRGQDVLVITPTMSTDYLAGRDDNLIRPVLLSSKQGSQLAEHAIGHGATNYAVVYDVSNSKYTRGVFEVFRKTVERHGGTVSSVSTIDRTKRSQMLPIAKQVMASAPDAVLLATSAIDAANVSQQLRKLGYKKRLYGVSWSQTNDLLTHGGRAVEDMVLVSFDSYGPPSEKMLKFMKAFKRRYNQDHSFVSVRTTDAASMLYSAMRKSEPLTPMTVKKTILAGRYSGLIMNISLDKFGDAQGDYNMVQVKNGQFKPID